VSVEANPWGWLRASDCDLDEFIALVEQPTDAGDYRFACAIEHGVVVYDSDELRSQIRSGDRRRDVMAELASVLSDGPGIALFRNAFTADVIGAASEVFAAIIADERAGGVARGDHFAKPGANDRVWNALQKHALRSPRTFADYYANDIVALAATAWLGPGYQLTAQVNVVNPGGDAQQPHRDYHLGFLTDEQAERFPAHVHRLSPALTLQGAIAHCDMPVETGPTMYLPHSQKYEAGYLAWRRADFMRCFADHHIQLPLALGDAVFFNPALFHAAGSNVTSNVARMANLLQVSSAFGRAMEDVNRRAMVTALYPVLLDRVRSGDGTATVDDVVAASAEGYAFPGDLDRDQPLDGLAPESDAAVVRRALAERWSPDRLTAVLAP